MSQVSGRHTACNIFEIFQEIIASFEINNKISSIITDNAYNMVNAFSNLSLPGFVYQQEESDNSDIEDDTDSLIEPNLDFEDVLALLPPVRNSCFAHTIQLVVKDGLSNADMFTKVISKVSTIISYVHKSCIATDILSGENRLQSSVPTRWNSQIIMIKSILKVDKEKLNTLNTAKLASYELNSLRDFVEILSPFEEATKIAQIENEVSSSLVIPCIRGLRAQMTTLCDKYSNGLVRELTESLERRLSKYESGDIYKIASTLDPRFKLKWCKNRVEKDLIKGYMLSKMVEVQLNKQNLPVILKCQDELPMPKRTKLFSFMESDDEEEACTTYTDETELNDYLSKPSVPIDSNPLTFWKNHENKYHKLSLLAQKYLAIPASSAAVERLFSVAGKIYRPDRCNLSDKNFETLMFIRGNM